jgi:anti-anti-sigma factor
MSDRPSCVLETLDGGVAVLHLVGEHDVSSASDIRTALLSCTSSTLVVVDLARCTFIDSTVVGVLIAGTRRLAESGGRLVTVEPQNLVQRALSMLGVGQILGVQDGTLADVLAQDPDCA